MWLSCTRMTVCCFHYQDLDVLSVCLTVPTIASDLVRPKLHCCMFYSVMVFGIVTELKHLALNCLKYILYSKTFLLLALNSSIFALYCGTCLNWLIFLNLSVQMMFLCQLCVCFAFRILETPLINGSPTDCDQWPLRKWQEHPTDQAVPRVPQLFCLQCLT